MDSAGTSRFHISASLTQTVLNGLYIPPGLGGPQDALEEGGGGGHVG